MIKCLYNVPSIVVDNHPSLDITNPTIFGILQFSLKMLKLSAVEANLVWSVALSLLCHFTTFVPSHGDIMFKHGNFSNEFIWQICRYGQRNNTRKSSRTLQALLLPFLMRLSLTKKNLNHRATYSFKLLHCHLQLKFSIKFWNSEVNSPILSILFDGWVLKFSKQFLQNKLFKQLSQRCSFFVVCSKQSLKNTRQEGKRKSTARTNVQNWNNTQK